jgi:hypothetical protein
MRSRITTSGLSFWRNRQKAAASGKPSTRKPALVRFRRTSSRMSVAVDDGYQLGHRRPRLEIEVL